MLFTARYHFPDGSTTSAALSLNGHRILLTKADMPQGCTAVDILSDEFTAQAGEDGYFVIPSLESNGNAAQIFFTEREDSTEQFPANSLPIYMVTHGERGLLAIVTGMRFEYTLKAEAKDGNYTLYPQFSIDWDYEQSALEIQLIELSGGEATWQGAARAYRRYQLDRKACRPLRDRLPEQPVLNTLLNGVEVRVRLAWKPVPSPVPEQTEETEPPIRVAITFDDCGKILDEFHHQGIEHAEFCLVGWNKSGHDGRFPDLFPVEPLLGGEEALVRLIQKARSYGYSIVGHTNLTDSYRIARRWKYENCLLDKDGSLHQCGNWAGGNSYYLCPKKAYEEYALQDMKDLCRLGFHGCHYFDVLSILVPTRCYSPDHPLTMEESASWRSKTLALAREKIGASASEGSWDFCISDMDYSLYTVYHRFGERHYNLVDHTIPFQQIVYHGIILYNTFCDTVNACIKSDKSLSVLNALYGGRPLNYFNAKFLSVGVNWLGNEDLIFSTQEKMASDVTAIKREYDAFRELAPLQLEFMDDFEELIPDALFRVTYSSGTVVYFNTSDRELSQGAVKVPAFSWHIVK